MELNEHGLPGKMTPSKPGDYPPVSPLGEYIALGVAALGAVILLIHFIF